MIRKVGKLKYDFGQVEHLHLIPNEQSENLAGTTLIQSRELNKSLTEELGAQEWMIKNEE